MTHSLFYFLFFILKALILLDILVISQGDLLTELCLSSVIPTHSNIGGSSGIHLLSLSILPGSVCFNPSRQQESGLRSSPSYCHMKCLYSRALSENMIIGVITSQISGYNNFSSRKGKAVPFLQNVSAEETFEFSPSSITASILFPYYLCIADSGSHIKVSLKMKVSLSLSVCHCCD